jgi:hypothetical protein
MNKPPVDQDDADGLIDRYQRASAADPSRPSDAARAAIAAQARVAAAARAERNGAARLETRTPAANDSHWRMRAAAGLAVVAVGALVAIQISRHPPAQSQTDEVVAQPPATARTAPPEVALPAAPAVAPAAVAPAPKTPQAPLLARSVLSEQAPAAERSEARMAAGAAAPAAANMADAAATVAAPGPQAQQARQAMPGPPSLDAALVTRYFPDAFSGSADRPPMWLLVDRDGRVVHAGRHAAGGEAGLRMYLEERFPGVRIGEYQSVAVLDREGRQATVAVARIATE